MMHPRAMATLRSWLAVAAVSATAAATVGCNDELLPPKRDLKAVEDLGMEDLVAPPDVAVPGPPAGSVLLNEVHPANVNGLTDEDKESSDWIELYNPTDQPVDLTGVGLSDSVDSPFTWVFPPGAAIGARSYLVIFASGKNRAVWGRPLHTSFTLNNGEDAVSLVAPGGVQLDYLAPSRTKVNISRCRMPDAVGSFALCLFPTPGAANAGIAHPSMLSPPSFSVVGGFYDTHQSVELSTFEPGATVRFTLDSSEPTASSAPYQAPIIASAFHSPGTYKVTVIRAATFADGKLSSPINTHTYIVDTDVANRYQTNLIAINVDPLQLTGPNGIITNATKGGYNNWADISAAGSIEYFRPDRSLRLPQ